MLSRRIDNTTMNIDGGNKVKKMNLNIPVGYNSFFLITIILNQKSGPSGEKKPNIKIFNHSGLYYFTNTEPRYAD